MNILPIYQVFFSILLICVVCCLYRIGRGPTPPDRTTGIEIMGVIIVGFCALWSVITEQDLFMNVAIAWSMLSFIGTLALSKHIEGKGFDE